MVKAKTNPGSRPFAATDRASPHLVSCTAWYRLAGSMTMMTSAKMFDTTNCKYEMDQTAYCG